MRRFWLEDVISEGQEIISLSGDILHHVRDVCRMVVGDRFELLSPQKLAFFVELKDVSKKKAIAKILEVRSLPELKTPLIHLCLSIPKFASFEAVIEKSVELGVASIKPFFSDYSFVKSKAKINTSREVRWAKIVKNATQQTGRGSLMPIDSAIPLSELLKNFNQKPSKQGLFPYEGESAQSVSEALQQWSQSPKEEIWLFVGSEGGFSFKEVQLFQEFGLLATTLGEQILRVETACVALVSIIKYHENLWS
ncbi:MAG: 16S rRNA (uracil(1498)-N(3))-methyltransferase [Bdellovibrionales bacterium]|nr:16S rRNA (uracil(1498)-N(3))-methyltransferase [Bdellovibrionales bacterium]